MASLDKFFEKSEWVKLHSAKFWYSFKFIASIIFLVALMFLLGYVYFRDVVMKFINGTLECLEFYSSVSNALFNFSIIIIPLSLWISRFTKKFKEDKDDLLFLRQYLINIRHEKAEQIKPETKLKDSPFIISKIDDLLRKFDLKKQANILYYSITDKSIGYIDNIIIEVIHKIREYDGGENYRRLRDELNSYVEEFRRLLKNPSNLNLYQEINEKFTDRFKKQIGYVLAYELFLEEKYKSGNAFKYYHDSGTDEDS